MYRHPFTTQDAYAKGITHSALKYGVRTGALQRLRRGIYLEGPEAPTPLEQALGVVIATDGIASGTLAGVFHQLDSINLYGRVVTIPSDGSTRQPCVTRRDIPTCEITVIDGYKCTNAVRTMIDLAAILNDLQWEQALESALRKRHFQIAQLEAALEGMHKARGGNRIRRVLSVRPPGAPAAESLLEVLMVQLIRSEPRLPEPQRQVVVLSQWDAFVARVDLAWPEIGVFLELDGQHHKDQPVYDARRETAVVAAKGWLPARFTWHEITRAAKPTIWRLVEIFEKASELHRSNLTPPIESPSLLLLGRNSHK